MNSNRGISKKRYLLLTFDLEEFVRPLEMGIGYSKDALFETSKEGFNEIIKILDEFKIKATFFVTYDFARRYPQSIKDLIHNGHEIALHAYKHSDNYNDLGKSESYRILKKAKDYLEKTFNIKIRGFRHPRLRSINLEILKNLKIKYDSSLHPTYIPGNYFHIFSSRKIKVKNGVTVVPISVAAFFRFPFSWFWFRNFGLTYAKFCTRMSLANMDYINIYLHPWDFADLSRYGGIVNFLFIRNSGRIFSSMFRKYLSFCKDLNLEPLTISSYLSRSWSEKQ